MDNNSRLLRKLGESSPRISCESLLLVVYTSLLSLLLPLLISPIKQIAHSQDPFKRFTVQDAHHFSYFVTSIPTVDRQRLDYLASRLLRYLVSYYSIPPVLCDGFADLYPH